MTTLKHIKAIAARSQPTLMQDAAGAAALMLILVMGLYAPVLI